MFVGERAERVLSHKSTLIACTAAMICMNLASLVINASIYSAMASFFGIGREIATLMTACMFLIIAAIALKRPALLNEKRINAGVLILFVIAIGLLAFALQIQNPALLMVGLLFRSIGSAWATVVFSVALTNISSTRNVMVAVGIGMVLSDIIGWFYPASTPALVASALLALFTALPIFLTMRFASPLLASIRQSKSASMLGLGKFSGFDALKSLVLCMLMISVAAGYSLVFNEVADAPIETYAETLMIIVVVAIIYVSDARKTKSERPFRGSEDQLFSLAALLIVAGYLLVPYAFSNDTSAVNTLLRGGRDCFTMLVWLVLVSVGRRNIFLLLPVLGLVRCASSIGTDIGAVAGRAVNGLAMQDPLLAGQLTSLVAFVFVAFLWLGFRNFSFSRAIAGVKEVTKPDLAQLDDRIERHCQDLGQQHGLTERETEILCLLAKGRDGRFIADQYVLSYNTVKTHIKHIYQKLDVHSRQELINLTELT